MNTTARDRSRKPAPHAPPPGVGLSDEHRRALVEGSAIDPAVIAERGVRTVRKRSAPLPKTYSRRQRERGDGILFSVHRPVGRTATLFRPDAADPERPGHKYEAEVKCLGGSGNVLDVHPSLRHLIGDVGVPVIFVEGVKKADSITSASRAAGIDLLAVAVSGTWNWKTDGEPIPDMFDVPVEGRRAVIGYDSDMLRKPGVQHAAEELALHLTRRGAAVEVVYLPDQPDGSKCGADDFLAGGGTLADLLALARPFDPEGVQREKLSRNEKLRRALAYLTRRVEEMPAKGQRDCSKRAAWRACLALAAKRGKLASDGIEAVIPSMTGAEIAAMGQATFSRCLRDFVEDGFMRRIERERSEQATSYVLLAPPYPCRGGVSLTNDGGREQREGDNDGKEDGGEKQGGRERKVSPGESAIPPLPEMRWSVPGRKPRRGVAKGTRKVRQGRSLSGDVPAKRRPGKRRGEIVRHLAENGGEASREELLAIFGGPKTAWRDFKKQTLADLLGRRRQYKGQPLEIGPPVIELTEGGVRFVAGWEEALELHRALGGEQEAADEQKRNHLMQRIAYRRRNEKPADPGPGEAEESADGFIEELQPEADDWRGHPLDCECQGCLCAPTTAYVRIGGGA